MLLDFFESWNSKSRMGKFEVLVISYIFAICMELSIFSKNFFWNEYQKFVSIFYGDPLTDIITIHCFGNAYFFSSQSNFTSFHFCTKEVENSKE